MSFITKNKINNAQTVATSNHNNMAVETCYTSLRAKDCVSVSELYPCYVVVYMCCVSGVSTTLSLGCHVKHMTTASDNEYVPVVCVSYDNGK